MALQGFGVGLFQVAYFDIVTASIPRADRGVAGSLVMMTRTLGTVTGATVLMLLFQTWRDAALADGVAEVPAFLAGFGSTFRLAAALPAAVVVLGPAARLGAKCATLVGDVAAIMRVRIAMSRSIPAFQATDADEYEHFMGRWSARLAEPFLAFADIGAGKRVLDVGCGTGTLSIALAKQGVDVVGVDASEPYLDGARRRRPHTNISYEHGDACHLRYPSASFDACVSTLAIDVIPDADRVAVEMRRVTRPGGIVACGTFDNWGGFSALALVLDTGAVLDAGIRALRDFMLARPLTRPNGQADLWRNAGMIDVVEVPIVLGFDYADFADYWSSYSTGPIENSRKISAAMAPDLRSEIERHVRAGYLAGMPDGPRSFAIIVRAVRGIVPR